MTEVTKLEKIADDYIEDYLRDHPINDFSLESDLEEYIENVPSFNKNEILQEYLKSEKSSAIEVEIYNKLMNNAEGISGLSNNYNDIETPNSILLGNIHLFVFIIDSFVS